MRITALMAWLLLQTHGALAQFLPNQEPLTPLAYEVQRTTHIPQLLQLASSTYENKQYDDHIVVMERLVELMPQEAEYQYRLARGYALADQKSKAFNALIKLQQLGLSYDLDAQADFDNIRSLPVFNYINEGMRENGKPFGSGEIVFSINSAYAGMLYESLTWDSKRKDFLMGSVRDGSIIRINQAGERSVFVQPKAGTTEGPWGAMDVLADVEGDALWVASAAMSHYNGLTPQNSGMSGVFKYRLSDGELLQRILLPADKRPHLINQLHLAANGDLYMVNSFHNQVLKINQGENQIRAVFGTPRFQNIRGLTSDPKQRFLYFSDYEKGLFAVDLKAQQLIDLGRDQRAIYGGIEELTYDDGGLIIVQNGITPERVMRLILDESGATVDKIVPIEASHPMFDSPTYGTVIGDKFYYIANSQWVKTDLAGNLLPQQSWSPVTVLATDKHYEEAAQLAIQKSIKKTQDELQ